MRVQNHYQQTFEIDDADGSLLASLNLDPSECDEIMVKDLRQLYEAVEGNPDAEFGRTMSIAIIQERMLRRHDPKCEMFRAWLEENDYDYDLWDFDRDPDREYNGNQTWYIFDRDGRRMYRFQGEYKFVVDNPAIFREFQRKREDRQAGATLEQLL